MFSFRVPANKWAGFAHARLSQVWQTSFPLGSGPYHAKYESLCSHHVFLKTVIFAYPFA